LNCARCGKQLPRFLGGTETVKITLEDGQKIVCFDCMGKIKEEYASKKTCLNCTNRAAKICGQTKMPLKPINIGLDKYYVQAEKCTEYTTDIDTETETEIINSYKCPHCSKEIRNIHCTKCGGKITKTMSCSQCGSQISFGICPYCKKLAVGTLDSIDWKKTPKPIPAIANVVVLERGEEFLAVWNGDRETLVKTVGNWGTVQTGKQVEVGGLCLTNRKLIWMSQRGTFEKSWHVGCAVPLEEIRGISSQGSMIKLITITTSQEEYRFHLGNWFSKNISWIDREYFAPFIERAIEERRAEIEKTKKKENIQLVLDFGSLHEYMKNGGLVMQNTKCPQCGGSVKLPQDGSQTVCEYCGANIKAEDIFKKIKELIG
jgi:DNA-directed RNA polymerase subunit RPC12/RpoP